MRSSDLGLPVFAGATGGTTDNRFINPNMLFDQVNEGAATTPTATGYVVDQWACAVTQASKLSFQGLATTVPSGIARSLKISVASAYTSGTSDTFYLYQPIEGCNVADLAFGTASAQNVILSFYIYTSLAGTYAGALQNSAAARSYPFTFSVATANTWQLVTLSIPGDTSGTWLSGTNQIGLKVIIDLGSGSSFNGTAGAWASANTFRTSGSVSFVATASAVMYATGFCLSAGTSYQTPLLQPFQQQLAACQRYCEKSYDLGTALGTVTDNGCDLTETYDPVSATFVIPFRFKVTKMAVPTMTVYSAGTGATGKVYNDNASTDISVTFGNIGQAGCSVAGVSPGQGQQMQAHWLSTARL